MLKWSTCRPPMSSGSKFTLYLFPRCSNMWITTKLIIHINACLPIFHTHLPEKQLSSKSTRLEFEPTNLQLHGGKENKCFEGISYILLRRLHVWLSTELQSWHFNQEPSEASLADKRSCTSASAPNSNGVFMDEVHGTCSATNQGPHSVGTDKLHDGTHM